MAVNHNIGAVNHNIGAVNHNIGAVNHNIGAVNHNIGAVNHNIPNIPIGFKVKDDKFQCVQCSRIVFRKNTNNHRKVCKGCPCNACRTCGKVFRFQSAVSRHEKRCMAVKPIDNHTTSSSPSTLNTYKTDIVTTNNTILINNVTNNNTIVNIQLNVYGQENVDTLCSVLRTKYPQAFRNVVEDGDVATLLRLVHFNTDFPENQTIRKPTKKDISTEVHVGDGRWEKRPTKYVLDTFCESTTKRVFRDIIPTCTMPVTNYAYLNEIMYQQSKHASSTHHKTTECLLSPFQFGEQEQDEKELRAYITQTKESLTKEFPTLVHTPIFARTFKQSIQDRIKTYETKWGVTVVL